MAFLILVIAIVGGYFWFKIQANESATKEYNEKLELARRVLETAQNIRYELLADLNEIGGKLGSANRDEYTFSRKRRCRKICKKIRSGHTKPRGSFTMENGSRRGACENRNGSFRFINTEWANFGRMGEKLWT